MTCYQKSCLVALLIFIIYPMRVFAAIYPPGTDYAYYANSYRDFNGKIIEQGNIPKIDAWFKLKPEQKFLVNIGATVWNEESGISQMGFFISEQFFLGGYSSPTLSAKKGWMDTHNTRLCVSGFSKSTPFLGIDWYFDSENDTNNYLFLSPGYRYVFDDSLRLSASVDYVTSNDYGSEVRGYESLIEYKTDVSYFQGQLYWDQVQKIPATNCKYNFGVSQKITGGIGLISYKDQIGFLTGFTLQDDESWLINGMVVRDPYITPDIQYRLDANHMWKNEVSKTNTKSVIGISLNYDQTRQLDCTLKLCGEMLLADVVSCPINFRYTTQTDRHPAQISFDFVIRTDLSIFPPNVTEKLDW